MTKQEIYAETDRVNRDGIVRREAAWQKVRAAWSQTPVRRPLVVIDWVEGQDIASAQKVLRDLLGDR